MKTPSGKKKKPTSWRCGWKRWLAAAFYSLQGLRYAARTQAAFREELVLLLIACPLAYWITESWVIRALLVASVLLVLAMELLNTALEALTDKIMPDYDHVAAQVKDMGSAAVVLTLVVALLLWLAVIFD